MLTYEGAWRIRVIGKDSLYPQRIVISGSAHRTIPGEVGQTTEISGDRWRLTVEHNDGTGWRPNAKTTADPITRPNERAKQIVRTKDTTRFDSDPNDLVIQLEQLRAPVPISAAFAAGNLFAADSRDLRKLGDSLVTEHGTHLLGLEIRNTGTEAFGYDALLDISARSRSALSGHGIHVVDDWGAAVYRATGQEIFDGQVTVPPLDTGDAATVYFLVDSSEATSGMPEVEFELSREVAGRRVTTRSSAPIAVGPLTPAQSFGSTAQQRTDTSAAHQARPISAPHEPGR